MLLACACLLSACDRSPPSSAPDSAQSTKPQLVQTGTEHQTPSNLLVVHQPLSHEQQHLSSAYQLLQEHSVLDDLAQGVSASFRMTQPLTLEAKSCGEINAFYDPMTHTIELCYEIVDDLLQTADPENKDPNTDYMIGVIQFILLHELGHALIHMYDLPITGKEEDAVDQMAAFLLLEGATDTEDLEHSIDLLIHAATWFDDGSEGSYGDEAYAGAHSLNEQRFFNLLCWIYGSQPDAFAHFVSDGVLTEERAASCPDEYAVFSKAWSTLLSPYVLD